MNWSLFFIVLSVFSIFGLALFALFKFCDMLEKRYGSAMATFTFIAVLLLAAATAVGLVVPSH